MQPKDTNIETDNQYASLFQDQQKKIECTYEIIFNITARVLEENEAGQDISCKEVMTRNYHIPVKDKVEYKPFMDAFFSFLENCLSTSAKHAYEQTPEKE